MMGPKTDTMVSGMRGITRISFDRQQQDMENQTPTPCLAVINVGLVMTRGLSPGSGAGQKAGQPPLVVGTAAAPVVSTSVAPT
jgi:hypothetical protein